MEREMNQAFWHALKRCTVKCESEAVTPYYSKQNKHTVDPH